jgi:Tfp pilus assembly protein PilF
MSLLMDALRRAEAAGTAPAVEDTATATTAASPDMGAGTVPLQLEPLDGPLTGTATYATTANDPPPAASTTAPAPLAASARLQQKASAAAGVFATRRSSWHNHSLFVLSGVAAALTLLVAYYFGTGRSPVDSTRPVSTTLIDTPTEPARTTAPLEVEREPAPANNPGEAAAIPLPPAPVAVDDTAQPVPTPASDDNAHEPAQTQPTATPRMEIHKSQHSPTVPPALQRAYHAYRAQRYQQAEQLYGEVLHRYPSNRDALLGLAAVALHLGDRQRAHDYYARLLDYDPADKAALIGLQGLSGDTHSLEEGSKLKYWLQSDPDNAQLHFALGNRYAAVGQWQEAQQAYFDAFRLQQNSAEYAFNLAVSLDQLNQRDQALAYYRQARNLAVSGGALFSVEQLEQRIRQLAALPENAP